VLILFHSGLEDQFQKQNEWNENMQQGMETVVQRYDEIRLCKRL
jgi:hypothetical protein